MFCIGSDASYILLYLYFLLIKLSRIINVTIKPEVNRKANFGLSDPTITRLIILYKLYGKINKGNRINGFHQFELDKNHCININVRIILINKSL